VRQDYHQYPEAQPLTYKQPRPGRSVTDAHIRSPAYIVVIVGSDTTVTSVNVPPPVLSDHSTLDLRCANHHGSTSATCREWRSFNYDDFERDLQRSSLGCSPPSDVNELVTAYDDTLTSLLDVYAPYRAVRRSTRPSQDWFDAVLAKHFTSKVDKIRASTASDGPPDIGGRPSSVLSTLSSFQHVTVNEVYKLIRRAPYKHCPLDPVPTWLVKCAADVLAPVITSICNASGCFPDFYKKKPSDCLFEETVIESR